MPSKTGLLTDPVNQYKTGTDACLHTGGCGFQLDRNVSLYTSTDLSAWIFRGYGFQISSITIQEIMFGVHVLRNRKTEKWVMWFKFLLATGIMSLSRSVLLPDRIHRKAPFNWSLI